MASLTPHGMMAYRRFLEPLWLKTHMEWDKDGTPITLSAHMCRYTCLFLKTILEKKHHIFCTLQTGCPDENVNGTAEGLYGFQDDLGNWHDHSWLIADGQIIDITADQFGDAPVIICDASNKKYNPSPDQALFIPAFQKLSEKAAGWLKAFDDSLL